MIFMARRASWWTVCITCLVVACGGGDDGDEGGAGAAATGEAGSVASGAAGASEGEEGSSCDDVAGCQQGLQCIVGSVYADDQGNEVSLRVCARACNDAAQDCDADEVCESPSSDSSQALCLNVSSELFGSCGPLDTSRCASPYECLPIYLDDQLQGGTCIQICTLPSASQSLSACPEGLVCANVLGDNELGACARTAARGQECGVGIVCDSTDLCVISEGATAYCFQDCSDAATPCTDGKTCTPLANGGGFCE